MAMQSSDSQAGVTPQKLIRPRVGLYPTTPLKPAGDLPLPAVSVAAEKDTSSAPTLTQLPEELPPEIYSVLKTDRGIPYKLRQPVSPVARH